MSAHSLCIGEIFTDRRKGFSLLRSMYPLIPIVKKRTFLSCKSVIVHKSFIYGFRYSVFKVLVTPCYVILLLRCAYVASHCTLGNFYLKLFDVFENIFFLASFDTVVCIALSLSYAEFFDVFALKSL